MHSPVAPTFVCVLRAGEDGLRKPKKRKLRLFARPALPPERFHSTKRGRRGYLRRESRRDERRAREELD